MQQRMDTYGQWESTVGDYLSRADVVGRHETVLPGIAELLRQKLGADVLQSDKCPPEARPMLGIACVRYNDALRARAVIANMGGPFDEDGWMLALWEETKRSAARLRVN